MADDPLDVDPAAPVGPEPYDQNAINAANFGADGQGDLPLGVSIEEQSLQQLKTVQFDIDAALGFLHACETSIPRVGYRLGAKIPFNANPGRDFTAVDCSGFVREVVRRSTNLGNSFPDGSVTQHDWIKARGFGATSVAAGAIKDGAVRIAFLAPTPQRKIGHVVLIYNAATIESHGGVGPDSRQWNGQAWHADTSVYVFSEPAE